jgi:PAS domain-containing protein
MKLTINNDTSISSIQKEFNNVFPYLKIEFFKNKHAAFQSNSKKELLNAEQSLKQFQKKHHDGVILVKEDMSVAELEQQFQEIFGVSTQVFRKSGKSWLETSVTDDWSLKQQNDEGLELSKFAS